MIPVLGIVSCLYLMLSLPVATWVRFLGWLTSACSSTGSTAASTARCGMPPRLAGTPLENIGNFVTVAGALLLFNGFFMTILGFMTVLGITTEELAKWHEIGVTRSNPINWACWCWAPAWSSS